MLFRSEQPKDDWDLMWIDTGITTEHFSKLKPYQKINHFPGMRCLARKNNLARNLARMRRHFPNDYSFFPSTWLLPAEYRDFKAQCPRNKSNIYIAKPEALSQGKGIFLIRSASELNPHEHYVVQKYINQPYLIDGLKFDLRIYAMVYGCDPLRIYIYKEGLVRLATEKYKPATNRNMENMYMHLTNYAINKTSNKYVFNNSEEKADSGSKRSLAFMWTYIDSHGGNSQFVQQRIRRTIVKTLCSVQPQLAHAYNECQPSDAKNDMCFEVLGFDIMLDENLRPWLLEVNHSPSFTTDTPFDHKIGRASCRERVSSPV